MFDAIKNTIKNLLATIDGVARTTQKTVTLVEAEVDNLHHYQEIRMTENEAELHAARVKLGLVEDNKPAVISLEGSQTA